MKYFWILIIFGLIENAHAECDLKNDEIIYNFEIITTSHVEFKATYSKSELGYIYKIKCDKKTLTCSGEYATISSQEITDFKYFENSIIVNSEYARNIVDKQLSTLKNVSITKQMRIVQKLTKILFSSLTSLNGIWVKHENTFILFESSNQKKIYLIDVTSSTLLIGETICGFNSA